MKILLRTVRRAKDITQRELADASNVSISTIAEIERGARINTSVDIIVKLARVLEVSLDDLIQY